MKINSTSNAPLSANTQSRPNASATKVQQPKAQAGGLPKDTANLTSTLNKPQGKGAIRSGKNG